MRSEIEPSAYNFTAPRRTPFVTETGMQAGGNHLVEMRSADVVVEPNLQRTRVARILRALHGQRITVRITADVTPFETNILEMSAAPCR